MRIALDARRLWDGSGIGRVTELVLDVMATFGRQHEVVALVRPETDPSAKWPQAVGVVTDIPFFSKRDLYDLPQLISACRAELFIAPQFYVTPFSNVPTIRIIHDMWPLFRPDWLPTVEDLVDHFGPECHEGIADILSRFEETRREGTLFPDNSFIRSRLPVVRNNTVAYYAVAMMSIALQLSQRLITVSEYSKSEIEAIFPEVSSKLAVVHNYVVDSLFANDEEPGQRRGILHVSKLDPRKNHNGLLKALEIIRAELGPDVTLTIAGGTGYRRYSRDIINTFNSTPGVVYSGHVKDDLLLRTMYQAARVFVFPSFHEGFGIPVLEAMASGTPVVASNITAIPEVCGDAAVLVNPHDEREIADAVIAVCTDKALEKRLRKAGGGRARLFTKQRAARALREVLDQILQPSSLDRVE
ncbi:MAG TPA: glycosyltransferase family 1 protein [Nitrospiraceae bacterium]|nr:glycosyltransferase family 1 protein [Nitrospiraceae bacterium]